eukprot:s268_g17.t1
MRSTMFATVTHPAFASLSLAQANNQFGNREETDANPVGSPKTVREGTGLMAANGNGAISKIGDMSELLGLSKLQEVLQNLAEEQAKVDVVQKQQDEQVSTALQRLAVVEATCETLPQIQHQLQAVQEQTKALEEATRQLREQEAQLSSQAARLTLLEKQVNDRLASLESKVVRLETSEENHYTEVKAALVSIREGNERAAEVQAQEDARRKAREEEERRQEEAAEEQRRREREALEVQLAEQGCGSTQKRSMGHCHWAVVVLLTCRLVAALSSDRTKWRDNEPKDQVERSFLSSKSGYPKFTSEDWEADLIKDGDSDGGAWEAQVDYDNTLKQHHDLEEEAQKFLEKSQIAKKEYEDAQKKELKLRDKMVKAFGLAKQQKNTIEALETKQTYQEEALKWVQEDVKYGQSQVQKYEEDIKEVKADIGMLKQRIRNITEA